MQGAAPFGDPAVNVPREVREKLDGIARRIEALNPTPRPAAADKARLAGTWRVRYSDCVPPSNGQLGPLVGEPFQVVKMDGTYENRLRFLGGKLQVSSRSRAAPRCAPQPAARAPRPHRARRHHCTRLAAPSLARGGLRARARWCCSRRGKR